MLRVHDDCDEEREDDVGEEHDEAVQVDPWEAVNHRRTVGNHAERRKHVVAWNQKMNQSKTEKSWRITEIAQNSKLTKNSNKIPDQRNSNDFYWSSAFSWKNRFTF